MQETDQLWLAKRNAELEDLVTELRSQLESRSVPDRATAPKALAPERSIENEAVLDRQVAQLEHKIEQLQAEVSRRRREQESLKQSEQRYRSIIEALHEAVIVLNAEGVIEMSNANAAKILECTTEELIDRHLLDLDWDAIHEDGSTFDPQDFPGLITAKTGIACSEVVLGLRKPEQQITWISINSQPLFQSGQVLPDAIVVSFSDISLRRWIEKERHQLLEREQAARKQIHQVLQRIADGFVALDRSDRFTYINPEAANVLGKPANALLGKVLWQAFPDFADTSFGRLYRRAFVENVPLELLDYYEPCQRWYAVRAYPSQSGVSLFFRNMTDSVQTARERDRAQETLKGALLQESEERFRQLAENIQQIFWMYDVESKKLIYISPACQQVLGYDSQSCYEKSLNFWMNRSRPEDVPHLMKVSRQALRGKPTEATFQFLRKDGVEHASQGHRWLRARAFPVQNAEGKIYRIAGIAEDITEAKHHEAERREQEQRLRLLESVIVNASDAVVITEAEPVEPPGPQIIYVNDAFTKMMGYDRDEVIGKTPRILQGPNTDWEVLKDIRTALKNWQPAIAELVNYHKDGSEVWIELSIFPVTDQTGHYTYWVGLQRDITHRKQAETEMRKALEKERELSELKSNFVTTVSHEFRTPLSTILSSADMLEFYAKEEECAIEKQLEHIQRIQAASLNMKDLLSDVLVLERAEAKKVKFKPAPIDVLTFCETLVDEMRTNDQNQHELVFEPRTTLPEIRGYMDAKLMRQILTNLLSNALKYSPAGSTVFFRLGHDETKAYFEVQDQGIGIPVSDQARLFEAFHRAANVGMISGNGLGLAIVKQSIEVHQGNIHLMSQENEGTIVQVTLPLQPNAE